MVAKIIKYLISVFVVMQPEVSLRSLRKEIMRLEILQTVPLHHRISWYFILYFRYIEEHVQRTGVAIETQGFSLITSGKKRESLTVCMKQLCYSCNKCFHHNLIKAVKYLQLLYVWKSSCIYREMQRCTCTRISNL